MKKFFSFLLLSVIVGLSAIAQIPTTGLVSSWIFNGNANDESGNGNNGTITGATLTTDRFGNVNSAYSFDGSTNSIVIDSFGSKISSKEMTVSLWTYFTGQAGQNFDFILLPDNALNRLCFEEYIPNGANYTDYFDFGDEESWDGRIYHNFTTPNLNTWQHIVLISSFSQQKMKIYLNNTLIEEKSKATIIDTSILNSSNLNIGYKYNGKIDDFRVYNRALNSTEISALYNENITKCSITVTDTLVINANITGFNPITYQNNIKVYPNPTLDKITIDCGSNYNTLNNYTIKISNSLSQTVYESLVNKQTETIDMNLWTGKGIYFVHLIDTNNNTVEIKKIVLQ